MSKAFAKYPLEKHVFRPVRFEFIHPSFKAEYQIRRWLKHYIPGYIVDSFLRLMGDKPRMIKTFQKVDRANTELAYVQIP